MPFRYHGDFSLNNGRSYNPGRAFAPAGLASSPFARHYWGNLG
jgi:hypothetical protein